MLDEANVHNAADPVELWKTWNEATTNMRSSTLDDEGEEAFRDHGDYADLYSLWTKSSMLFKLWYDVTYGTWVRMFGDTMCQSLQIPSRTDMAHVVERIAALEERVYMVEDAFVNFEGDSLDAVPEHTTVAGDLAGRLERIEGKLDRLLDFLEQVK